MARREFLAGKVAVMKVKSKYDAVIAGGGHNGLVAAAYLVRAGLSVLLLEQNDWFGGAAASARLFPEFDARISRYSYLVSLFPEKIARDLGLHLEFRRRTTGSFTPYVRNGVPNGLLLSNVSEAESRASMRALTGSDAEFDQLSRFYQLPKIFAETIWPAMLEPLQSREQLKRAFSGDERSREAWRSLVEEPLGCAVERYLTDDLVRGVVFTDAKIGLFTSPDDPSLLQNRCFIYHTIGGGTGEWKVPAGGMGRVAGELERVAKESGVELISRAAVEALDLSPARRTVQFRAGDDLQTVEARFLFLNFGHNILARLLGQVYQPDHTHEGSVLKINMLLERLPRPLASQIAPRDAFCGTFHIDESYSEMQHSFRDASENRIPRKVPCEIYCHTLTDNSILSPALNARGFHTLTLFALDLPWRLFENNHDAMRECAARRCLEGLNAHLAEPIESCLARSSTGESCLEVKTPVDLERELGMYRGNIFHGALTFPFAETAGETGTWGVETEFENVFICGSSARRGGGVSGIPGHNTAMKILETLGRT